MLTDSFFVELASRIRATFEPGEGTATLREAGLFGGEKATADPDTGTLLVYYVHPRIGWLANVRTDEFHDLDKVTSQCQVDEIRFDRRFYLSGIAQAQELGYDFCAYSAPSGLALSRGAR